MRLIDDPSTTRAPIDMSDASLVLDKHAIGDSTSKLSPKLEVGLPSMLMGNASQPGDVLVLADRFQQSGGVTATHIHPRQQPVEEQGASVALASRPRLDRPTNFAVSEDLKLDSRRVLQRMKVATASRRSVTRMKRSTPRVPGRTAARASQ